MIFWGIGAIQLAETPYSMPNSPNFVDWNTQTESNLKSCCNFIYYILKSKVCKCTITTSNEALANSGVPTWPQVLMPTYLLQSIYFRQTHIQNHGLGHKKIGSQKYEMKNIKYGTLPSLCLASQIELSIRSCQTELSES